MHTSDFHSWLFPNFGYSAISIEIGTYKSNTKEDPMNVRFAIDTIRKSLMQGRAFDQQLFEDSKEQFKIEMRHDLSDSARWLKILRGMSLKVPVGIRLSVGDINYKTLKDVEYADMLELIESTTLDGFVKWTKQFGPTGDHVLLSSVVETVNEEDTPFHSESECNPIPF